MNIRSLLRRLRRFRLPLYIGSILAAAFAFDARNGFAALQAAGEAWNGADDFESIHRERARLDCEAVLVGNRIVIKEALIEDLIAGRQSFKAVAKGFAELNADDAMQRVLRTVYGEGGELELSAKSVFSYVSARVDDPSTRELLMAELHRQYRDLFGRDTPPYQ